MIHYCILNRFTSSYIIPLISAKYNRSIQTHVYKIHVSSACILKCIFVHLRQLYPGDCGVPYDSACHVLGGSAELFTRWPTDWTPSRLHWPAGGERFWHGDYAVPESCQANDHLSHCISLFLSISLSASSIHFLSKTISRCRDWYNSFAMPTYKWNYLIIQQELFLLPLFGESFLFAITAL